MNMDIFENMCIGMSSLASQAIFGNLLVTDSWPLFLLVSSKLSCGAVAPAMLKMRCLPGEPPLSGINHHETLQNVAKKITQQEIDDQLTIVNHQSTIIQHC